MNRTAPSGALLTAIALLGLPACETVLSPAPGGETWTKVELDERLTHAYTGFGFDLFRELRAESPERNVFASPTSAAFALAMTYNGAVGQTAEEMAIALGIEGMTRDEVNAANRAWIDALTDTQDRRAELAIANSIWYRSDWRVRDDFTQRTRDYYDAEVREMTTAEVINAWVEEHTNGRIDEIVQPPIPGDVVAYLINALYFKADWTHQFDARETRDAPFTRPDGSTVTVPMMWQRDAELPVRMGRVDESFDMVRLPYGNGRFSMVLALPRSDASLADVAKTLEPRSWTGWMDEFVDHEIAVALPRFEIEWESSLKTSLQALGMEIPFEAGLADFSDMFEGGGPWIDDVFQKTFLRVDEEGTEAAAVTKVVMVESAPPSLVFDRPFFLAIYDHATETVLFLGQITDPTG
jgi:serine protease inhibitor